MEEKFVNHWGKWVSSNVPVTGVVSNNSISWEWMDEVVCLDCSPEFNEDGEENWDFVECDGSHTKLYGDWTISDTKPTEEVRVLFFKDNKYYYPTVTDGDEVCSIISREDVCQIVYSSYTQRGALCSPCYPGQVDLDSEGEFLGYTLPPSLFYQEI